MRSRNVIHGLLIGSNGRMSEHSQRSRSLKPLYNVLDCELVERVPSGRTRALWVDEEGLYRQPFNPTLSALYHQLTGRWINLYGPGIFLGDDPDGIRSLSVPDSITIRNAYITIIREQDNS